MNKIQGMIKGADLENKIFQRAQNDQKAHRANPEEQRLAEASKVMIEEVGGTIAWARNKLNAFLKAKKDLGPLLDARLDPASECYLLVFSTSSEVSSVASVWIRC
ncbi:uncharacterized protein C8R40DRAFT_53572 [Lentinula edodes]|uniref:uncharacterized protein n=1 Tax=Lentinula edodes TaxID=5353 RepID=UPI001E8DA977|nr:uncharacterized protein C8R40DRAFT_53572 [Lentinula edodes]KAH7881597.1 hypothetical protein C8R40DRAFT_53572 [Lentinula edodes]